MAQPMIGTQPLFSIADPRTLNKARGSVFPRLFSTRAVLGDRNLVERGDLLIAQPPARGT